MQWREMSDSSLMETIGKFIKTNRLNQNKSQTQVANYAGISRSTLSLLERGEKVRMDSFIRVLRTLDLLHIMEVFSVQDQISPLKYAKVMMKKRKRAYNSVLKEPDSEYLGW